MSDRLSEIRKRVEAASKGPWKWQNKYLDEDNLYQDRQDIPLGQMLLWVTLDEPTRPCGQLPCQEDKEFIAHSREDIPYLLSQLSLRDDAIREAIEALENLKRGHIDCDDTWYSCPKAPDGCANDSAGTECNCGADKMNEKITALLSRLRAIGEKE